MVQVQYVGRLDEIAAILLKNRQSISDTGIQRSSGIHDRHIEGIGHGHVFAARTEQCSGNLVRYETDSDEPPVQALTGSRRIEHSLDECLKDGKFYGEKRAYQHERT